jgi:iron complex outermembrane receptor protein/hemoglobin/transferrin/lactoferrin receptor protein
VGSGSLGGSYELSENLVLALNVGRGFRAPTLFELFANGVHGGVAAVQVGNPELDPEQSLNTDLALRWRSPRLTASATVFHNRIDDYIFLTGSGEVAANGLPIFRHAQDDAVLRGVELFADIRLSESLELTLGYDTVDSENQATKEELPMQPADQLRAELGWYPQFSGPLRNPYARFTVRQVWSRDAVPGEPFAQFNNNPVFGSADTDDYTVADLSLGFEFGAAESTALSVVLDVRNLFDEAYRDFLHTYKAYALNPGRDIRLTLRLPFGW